MFRQLVDEVTNTNTTVQYYKQNEDDKLLIFCNGLVVFAKNGKTTTDLLEIAHAIVEEQLDYNDLYGFYRMVIVEKSQSKIIFFGDNSGSQRFFFDKQTGCFSDSLLALIKLNKRRALPNYSAIYQMLSYGGIFTDDTLVEGLFRTDSEKVYSLKDGEIKEETKKLNSLTLDEGKTLHDVMRILMQGIDTEHTCAVCTGGTDSRTILAHLASLGFYPELIITGHKDNPDIKVADKIAEALHVSLTIKDPDIKEPDWIEKGFLFSDGLYDVVLSYRHLKKIEWAVNKGFKFEFGGVGGEFYKNVYARPFRDKLLFKRVKMKDSFQVLFEDRMSRLSWLGENVSETGEQVKQEILSIIENFEERGNLHVMNRVGNRILQNKYSLICNNAASKGLCKVDPLMERDSIAKVSKKNPLKLTMNIWQRKEVNKYCKLLSDIETDQGYSCTVQRLKLEIERVRKLVFFISRIVARLRKRVGLSFKSSEPRYWDQDYVTAKQSEIFNASLERCRELGIIKKDAAGDMIANKYVGSIILIGMLFAK